MSVDPRPTLLLIAIFFLLTFFLLVGQMGCYSVVPVQAEADMSCYYHLCKIDEAKETGNYCHVAFQD